MVFKSRIQNVPNWFPGPSSSPNLLNFLVGPGGCAEGKVLLAVALSEASEYWLKAAKKYSIPDIISAKPAAIHSVRSKKQTTDSNIYRKPRATGYFR